MKSIKRAVHPHVLRELELTQLPFEFEMGKRHIKIRLDGHFVGILPKGSNATSEAYGQRWAMANSLAQIRRMARKLKELKAA